MANKISKFMIEGLTTLKYDELSKFEETVVQGMIVIIFLLIIKQQETDGKEVGI